MHPSSSPWQIASCCFVWSFRCPAAFHLYRRINCHSLSFAPVHMLACVGALGATGLETCMIACSCTLHQCSVHAQLLHRQTLQDQHHVHVSAQSRQTARATAAVSKVQRSLLLFGTVPARPLECHVPWLPAGIPPGAAMQLLQRSVIYDQHPQTTNRRGRTGEARGATIQKPGGTGQRTWQLWWEGQQLFQRRDPHAITPES